MFDAQPYRSNWWGYIEKRVLIAVVAFLVVSIAIFTFFFFCKDSSMLKIAPKFMPDNTKGLEYVIPTYIPFPEQYFRWLGGIFTGDWGHSLVYQVPVRDLIF
jgi:peptide/nickel transport system permease protein